MTKTHILAATFAAALGLAGPASAQHLTLASGPSGGTWFPLATAIGNIIQREVEGVRVSVVNGVTVANILGTHAGQYDLAMSLSTTNANAMLGEGEHFAEPQSNIRGVVNFYPAPFQMAVRADSDIHSVEDFAGRVVNPGVVGGSTDVLTHRILELHGMSFDDLGRVERLSYADASMQMRDGHLDVFTGIISVPAGAIAEVAVGSGVRLIGIDEQVVEALSADNPGYAAFEIPANTYQGQTEPALAVGMGNVLIARADLPDDLIEAITRALVENAEELHTVNAALRSFGPDTAGLGIGAPMHPGAAAFFSAAGLPAGN